eukprot:Gregarina_sp_Poly_1__7266@NODE_39_length_18147_cov_101_572069_g34_i0_p4_GENE_NODE_39_length_18147_cov_101_572069_g34_i0NODE_39_length_18147_cov_101_572069_g34_i0_p4_ORF_typecomplete_len478_score65_75Tubulin_3/PF14881_6/0_0014_NODE_39_length_18147_cov_101_572069_g34_i082299662
MLRTYESNEVLSVGLGHFGALAQTQFINGLDETVRRVEHDVGELTEASCVACGPFYREIREGVFEPNLVLGVQASEISAPSASGTQQNRHPYQEWADLPSKCPKPDFNFDKSVTSFQDIADFSLPLSQIARVRSQRPLWENVEVVEEALRRRIEACDHVAAVCVAQQLHTGAPDLDVPACHSFLLDELGSAAQVYFLGVSPMPQLTEVTPAFLAAIAQVADFHREFRNRTAKAILPVGFDLHYWHLGDGKGVQALQIPGIGSFDRHSAYQISAVAALAVDAVTLGFRHPSERRSPFGVIARLTPTFSPVVMASLSGVSACAATDTLPIAADISAFCPVRDSLIQNYPHHDFYALTNHGKSRPSISRCWSPERTYELAEPLAVGDASPFMPVGSSDKISLDVETVVRSPLSMGVEEFSGSRSNSFLLGSINFLELATKNSTFIDRADRENWVSILDEFLEVVDDLGIGDDTDKEEGHD